MSHPASQCYLFQIRWNTGRWDCHLSHHNISEHIIERESSQAQRTIKENYNDDSKYFTPRSDCVLFTKYLHELRTWNYDRVYKINFLGMAEL